MKRFFDKFKRFFKIDYHANDDNYLQWLRLGENICSAPNPQDWRCPECGSQIGISFCEGKHMCGLQLYCRKCSLGCDIDGTFKIPTWWSKEYK